MAQWRVTIYGARVEVSPLGVRWQHVVSFVYQKEFALDDSVSQVRELGLAAADHHEIKYSHVEKVELIYTDPRGVAT